MLPNVPLSQMIAPVGPESPKVSAVISIPLPLSANAPSTTISTAITKIASVS